jgi:hypothetical protein
LKEEETKWLITEPVQQWYTLSPSAVQEIVRVAGCHPYFTQMICGNLLDVRNEVRLNIMTVTHVREAVSRTLRSGDKQIGYPWIEPDCSPNERLVLSILANESTNSRPIAVDTIRQRLDEVTVKIGEAVTQLQERRIVQQDNEGKLTFVVPLFQEWIVRKGYHILAETLRYNEERQEIRTPRGKLRG